ncbi:MAG TPA: RNA 2',3'-cyclic phosphodiesterase [Gallionella sp.]
MNKRPEQAAPDREELPSLVKVFFALWPVDTEREALSAWQAVLKQLCGGRAMHRETLHATLVFLGQVEARRMEALQLAAQEVGAEDFELCLDQARYWGHNHIAYAAPGYVPEQLIRLVDALERSLRRHRFGFDRRAYKPHVTLLRNAHWTDEPFPALPPVRWRAGDFALVQSLGGEYRVLARFPFSASGG